MSRDFKVGDRVRQVVDVHAKPKGTEWVVTDTNTFFGYETRNDEFGQYAFFEHELERVGNDD